LDANFVKAHIRKAASYFAMGEYQKSIDACNSAQAADQTAPNTGSHGREIEQQLQRSSSAMYNVNSGASEEEILSRAQRDPEVLAILQDPIMQQILGQMKEDPSAVQDHLKNPMIREKIQKLVNAGIIRLGSR
jgi:stress-induced-phosphoprotein 1